jgi:hypothetical protein
VHSITAIAACGLALAPRFAAAQASDDTAQTGAAAPALKVAVLRATQGDAGDLANAIDGALLRDLGALAGIENPTVAPIDFAEIQLTVGCSDEGRQCLAAIAQMVQVDAVVVRHLEVEPGKATLTLVHYDATSSDEPAHAEQIVEGPDPGKALVDGVPSLVRRLFGIPEPVTAAAPASPESDQQPVDYEANPSGDQAEPHGPSVGPLTWVTLAVGTGVLAGGLILYGVASGHHDDFLHTEIHSESDIARANALLDKADTERKVSTVLMPAGAAVLALGVTLLVLDLTAGESGPQMALSPLPGGGMVSLRASGGGL